MVRFVIDTRENRVTVCAEPGGQVLLAREFSRRWEALLLAGLLDESRAGRALGSDALQSLVRTRGQASPLNRAQLQRLLSNAQSFLDEVPGLNARVEAPPRKQTVGPWRLSIEGPVTAEVDGVDGRSAWGHPALVRGDDTLVLQDVLGHLLVADAFAVEGRFHAAIEVLSTVDTTRLTTEGCGALLLRLCSWHKHVGEFQAARDCAQQVLARPAAADAGLEALARFYLLRIDYDQSPAANSDALWQSTAEAPSALSGQSSDWRLLSEWHNLRALLSRRRMHALAAEASAARGMHELAVRHMQAAIYSALWFRDWDRLQAYVANLAFHLQSTLLLDGVVEVTSTEVLRWHRLTMAYEDKFSAGRDSAWEYIFFAEFWLDHQPEQESVPVPDPLAHNLSSFYPDQEAYYVRALERLRECGDDRQVAIGHSLYLRFAREHLPPEAGEAAIAQQTEQLSRLLGTQKDDSLRLNLVQEGYAAHWPAALRRKPRTTGSGRIQEIQKRGAHRPVSDKKGT